MNRVKNSTNKVVKQVFDIQKTAIKTISGVVEKSRNTISRIAKGLT